MAVQQIIDYTATFNANGEIKIDIGGWDYVIAQIITPTDKINFEHTNDSGSVQAVSDGSAVSATNFLPVQGINMEDSTAINNISASGAVKFNGVCSYLRLGATGVTLNKLLIRFYKIN